MVYAVLRGWRGSGGRTAFLFAVPAGLVHFDDVNCGLYGFGVSMDCSALARGDAWCARGGDGDPGSEGSALGFQSASEAG